MKRLLTSLAVMLVGTAALAHGGVGIERDPCVEMVGLYLVHFAAYQPQVDPTGEYCRSLPKPGHALFVFDLVDRELREMPADLRIIEDAKEGHTPETVLYVPPQTYPQGVMNAEVNFSSPGRYTAIVTFRDTNRTLRFPVRVAQWSGALLVVAALLVMGAIVGYFAYSRYRRGRA